MRSLRLESWVCVWCGVWCGVCVGVGVDFRLFQELAGPPPINPSTDESPLQFRIVTSYCLIGPRLYRIGRRPYTVSPPDYRYLPEYIQDICHISVYVQNTA